MNSQLFVILIALSAYSASAYGDTTLTKVTEFDDYTKILEAALSPEEKLRTLEAVWAQIRRDYPKDVAKTADLYDNLRSTFSDTTVLEDNTVQSVSELEHGLRLEVIKLNGQLLATALRGKQFPHAGASANFTQQLLQRYHTPLVHKIYSHAIELSYDASDADYLATKIYKLMDNDLRTFEVMTQAQLQLFWKFRKEAEVSNAFFFNIAFYLSQIKKHANFKLMPFNLNERFEKAVPELPDVLRHFFFDVVVYLENKHYSTYLITSDIDVNSEKRMVVMTTKEVRNMDWVLHISEVPSTDDTLTVQVLLYSNMKNMYTYLEKEQEGYEYMPMAWRKTGVPKLAAWTVNYMPHEDYLVLRQNDMFICATDKVIDEQQSYSQTYSYKSYQEIPNECQWIVG